MTTQDRIAKAVRTKFDQKGLALSDLARILDIDKGGVWRRLRGDYAWRSHELSDVADILGLTVEDVLVGRETADG